MKFSIGELEKLTGMNRTALRYYDAEGLTLLVFLLVDMTVTEHLRHHVG